VIPDVGADSRLASVVDAAAEAGIENAVAVPLLAQEDVTGLLGIFPAKGKPLSENESALLAALAAQLAVAVQNAQLHERTTRLGAERERALEAERAASKQVRALYEISRSFAQSLSLERRWRLSRARSSTCSTSTLRSSGCRTNAVTGCCRARFALRSRGSRKPRERSCSGRSRSVHMRSSGCSGSPNRSS